MPTQVWRNHADIDTGNVPAAAPIPYRRRRRPRSCSRPTATTGPECPPSATSISSNDIGVRSPVAAFQAGDVDYTGSVRQTRPGSATTSTSGRCFASGRLAVARVTRLHHRSANLRRRTRPAGIRGRGRLDAHHEPRLARRRGPGHEHGAAGHQAGGGTASWLPAHDPAHAR